MLGISSMRCSTPMPHALCMPLTSYATTLDPALSSSLGRPPHVCTAFLPTPAPQSSLKQWCCADNSHPAQIFCSPMPYFVLFVLPFILPWATCAPCHIPPSARRHGRTTRSLPFDANTLPRYILLAPKDKDHYSPILDLERTLYTIIERE